MAYYNFITTNSSSLVERALAAVAHQLENAAIRHAQRRVFRNTFDEMSALSNRELADLGVSRSELKRIAWEASQGANVTQRA